MACALLGFVMEILFPVIVILVFFIGSFVLLTVHLRKMSVRRALPDRAAYLRQAGSGACAHCGGSEQREYGLDDRADRKRIVACAVCGKDLFQYLRDETA